MSKRLVAVSVLSALLAGLVPARATALSCIPPDPVRDFLQAEEDDAIWIVVDGKLHFDKSKLPARDLSDPNAAPPRTDIAARLKGTSLGPDGFEKPFDRQITLRVLCFGPWCGGATPGERYMAFLKREGAGYVMPSDPCGNNVYPGATAAMRAAVTRCFNGGACQPKPF